MTISTNAQAFQKQHAGLTAAIRHTNPDLSGAALARTRREMVATARAGVVIPETVDLAALRSGVLAARVPTTADAIAVQANDWAKVQTLIDNGRSLDSIVANANPVRAAAILNNIETLPAVMTSGDPEAVAAELHDALFSRLVELGEPDAVSAAQAEAEAAPGNAWHQVFTEMQAGQQVTMSAKTALYKAAPDDYRAVSELINDPGLAAAVAAVEAGNGASAD